MTAINKPADAPDALSLEELGEASLGFRELAAIGVDAWRAIPYSMVMLSILGLPGSWIARGDRYSEYRIINVWRLARTLRFCANVMIPSVPRTPPPFMPPVLGRLFYQPTVVLQRPDHNGSYTSFPDEAWFFVNGVASNDSVAQINSAYLSYLFHRPLTMIQNSTDSLPLDLAECILGKQWYRYTEAATKAFPPIYDALRREDKRRVVVIAHSQGTIIMATVLSMLAAVLQPAEPATRAFLGVELVEYAPPEFVYPDQDPWRKEDFIPLTEEELAKLEVYCFANCANTMKYIGTDGGRPVPHLESFGNENDLVARLGMLAPQQSERGIDIDGTCYMKPGGWGHLLNAHYLRDIDQHQKHGRRLGCCETSAPYVLVDADGETNAAVPRLFRYINGGEPEEY